MVDASYHSFRSGKLNWQNEARRDHSSTEFPIPREEEFNGSTPPQLRDSKTQKNNFPVKRNEKLTLPSQAGVLRLIILVDLSVFFE
jgi:hypothetical protein